MLHIGLFSKLGWTSVIRARRADLDQTGSPTWSAAGRTGGEQTGPGCPCDERRKQARGGGELVRPPSLGGYLEAREVKVTFTKRHARWGQTFRIATSMTKASHINHKCQRFLTSRSERSQILTYLLRSKIQITLAGLKINSDKTFRSLCAAFLTRDHLT